MFKEIVSVFQPCYLIHKVKWRRWRKSGELRLNFSKLIKNDDYIMLDLL
jgi:hypothetical protein